MPLMHEAYVIEEISADCGNDYCCLPEPCGSNYGGDRPCGIGLSASSPYSGLASSAQVRGAWLCSRGSPRGGFSMFKSDLEKKCWESPVQIGQNPSKIEGPGDHRNRLRRP